MLIFLLLLVALPVAAQAQSNAVRLELRDAVERNATLRDRPLPEGTLVWVAQKAETRAVRLREGYDEVRAGLRSAQRDSVGAESRTARAYARTSQVGRAYFVFAQTPDGRFLQSFVETADAGMQPGFDAVISGRILMGPIADDVAASLLAIVQPPVVVQEPEPVVADTASLAPEQVLEQELHEALPTSQEDIVPKASALPSLALMVGGAVLFGIAGWVLGWTFRSSRSRQEMATLQRSLSETQNDAKALAEEVDHVRATYEEHLEEERFRYATLLSQTRMLQELNTEQAAALERLLAARGGDEPNPAQL